MEEAIPAGIIVIACAVIFAIFAVPFVEGAIFFRDFLVYILEWEFAWIRGEKPPRFKQLGWLIPYIRELDDTQRGLLNRYCPYYAALDPELKVRFERRLIRFRYEKDFYYTKESEKNRELMILLMCAFAIQVTFGFKKYMLRHFHSIHIHKQGFYLEDNYWVRLSGFTAGSVGYVALSETAFLKSIEHPADGFNVAVHEFAHAVEICDKLQDEYIPWYTMLSWKDHATDAWEELCRAEKHFLPEYAEKDVDEFFACSVESFFERPEEMQVQMPATYEQLRHFLRQDPLNRANPVVQVS